LWTRADLEQRWARGEAPLDVSRARDPAVLGLNGAAWAGFSDAHDPDTLGQAVEFRHPLLDLRLIRFAIALPAIPWCANKYLFRRCLDDLPPEIRRRPKTPLARDPTTELICRGGLGSVPAPEVSEVLAPLLDLRAAWEVLRRTSAPTDDTWFALRALALGNWLQQRDVGQTAASTARLAC
jgi:hypothetical protein